MNLNKNYYSLLSVQKTAESNQIKKAYYKLSFVHHPDKGGDESIFSDITEAYNILMDTSTRIDYDSKSRFGQFYDETLELLNVNVEFDYQTDQKKKEDFKKNEVLNVQIAIDDTFDGKIEYERWVLCKECDGSGKDLTSKILIRDEEGKIVKIFDSIDGCDFCEGTGKDFRGQDCSFCFGKGKSGINPCNGCGGTQRVYGKQKLTGIKLTGKETKVDHMGHYSKDEPGRVGYLLLISP